MKADVISTTLDALRTAATAAGVWVAWRGLRTWQRQLLGTADHDLARRLLRAAYEVRDRIALLRARYFFAGEMDAALRDAGLEHDPQSLVPHPRSTELAVLQRHRMVVEAFAALQVEVAEAEVLWGDGVRAAERDLALLLNRLGYAIQEYGFEEARRRSGERLDLKDRERWFDTLFAGDSAGSKKFTEEVAAAVGKFEALARPHLDGTASPRRRKRLAPGTNGRV